MTAFLQALASLAGLIIFGAVVTAGCLYADRCSDRQWRSALDRADRTRKGLPR